MKTASTFILILFTLNYSIAQTGQFDVRLIQQDPFQCGDATIYFDIQLKASNAGTVFRVSEQNYRFDYDSLALTNPRIYQSFNLSGMVDDGTGTSVYKIHSLNGTLGNTISYGIELVSGVGYLLTDAWLPIGRIAFDVLDPSACLNLVWLTHSDFPATFIGEISNTELFEIPEGTYGGYSGCLSDICITTTCPDSLNLSGIIVDDTYQANTNITSDGNVLDGGNVIYRAGENISLVNGFSVKAQADFSADISDCDETSGQ